MAALYVWYPLDNAASRKGVVTHESGGRTWSAQLDLAGRFAPAVPADVVYMEPHPRRVQAVRDGRLVIDTERALMVHRRAGR